MFITTDELKSAAFSYQITEITDGDTDIAAMAISAAVDEMRGYLRNYDTTAIFAATGTDRNALLMELCKNIAVWYLIRLANVDMLYTQVKERYDRAIDWLKNVAAGKIAPSLPEATDPTKLNDRFRLGSNTKFNHYYD